VKTIVSRAGRDTKVVLAGDPFQIDNPYLDASSNGLSTLVDRFQQEQVFGHIWLERSERSDLARLAAGQRPLAPHPLLCELARERAAAIVVSGDPTADRDHLERTTRRLYRGGYKPHFWSEGALIGGSPSGVLEQLAGVRPDWVEEAVGGEFDHLGVATATLDGQPVVTFMLALHKCTVERRQAAELSGLEAVRATALERVNHHRRQSGRQPLRGDPRLDAAAQGHAEDLLRRSYYSHRSPEGGTPASRARGAGFVHQRLVAENIAKGLFTPNEAVDRWMDSSGHRRNVLQRRATATGLGVAVGPGDQECFDVYWVQLLAG